MNIYKNMQEKNQGQGQWRWVVGRLPGAMQLTLKSMGAKKRGGSKVDVWTKKGV